MPLQTFPPDPRTAALRKALFGIAPESVKEPSHLTQMLSLLDYAGALSRDHFQVGHFTASAFIVCPLERRLLLIRHKKLNLWLQPGGHIEPADESVFAASLREAVEETEIADLEPLAEVFDLDVHEIPAWKDTPAHLHHDVRSLLRAGSLKVRAGEDVADARWFDLEEVASSGPTLYDDVGTDHSVRRVAQGLLSGQRTLLSGGSSR